MDFKVGFCFFVLTFCYWSLGASLTDPGRKNVCAKEWLACINKNASVKKKSGSDELAGDLSGKVVEIETKSPTNSLITEDGDLNTSILKELNQMTARLSELRGVMLRKTFKNMCICNNASIQNGDKTALKIPVKKFGKEYAFYLVKQTWDDAKVFCETHGSHLAVIETKTENTFIQNFIRKHYLLSSMERIWFGATDKEIEGQWKWVSNKPLTYNDWTRQEPNNLGIENCIQYFKPQNFHWNDGRCSEEWPILCERNLK